MHDQGSSRPRPVTLVLGGARSGKSVQAERLVEASRLRPVYVATSEPHDEEMRERIAAHRARRGEGWRTVEEPLHLADTLAAEAKPDRIVLVNCLTLWVSNLMMAERDIGHETHRLTDTLAGGLEGPVILVSNEVGLGIVPDNALARAFRDHAGRLNEAVAAVADSVVFVAAGLPLRLKG